METKKMKTQDLRLARVRYYDTKHNGAELSNLEAYAFLRKAGERFYNVFDVVEDLPVLDRMPYSCTTRSGEDYGNILIHVQGELVDGPCYVIEPFTARDVLGVEKVSEEELRQYIYRSKNFYVDRLKMLEDEPGRVRLKMLKTILSDKRRMEQLKAEFASHQNGKPYIK